MATNGTRNDSYGAARIYDPPTLDELRTLAAAAPAFAPLVRATRSRELAGPADRIGRAPRPFDERGHWGKLFLHAGTHARLEAFVAQARLDPRGAFRNQ